MLFSLAATALGMGLSAERRCWVYVCEMLYKVVGIPNDKNGSIKKNQVNQTSNFMTFGFDQAKVHTICHAIYHYCTSC